MCAECNTLAHTRTHVKIYASGTCLKSRNEKPPAPWPSICLAIQGKLEHHSDVMGGPGALLLHDSLPSASALPSPTTMTVHCFWQQDISNMAHGCRRGIHLSDWMTVLGGLFVMAWVRVTDLPLRGGHRTCTPHPEIEPYPGRGQPELEDLERTEGWYPRLQFRECIAGSAATCRDFL
jgi:hypothetical protein